VLIGLLLYLNYMIGLILVLRRLGRMSWWAYVPLLNYFAQMRALGAPRRWYLLSCIPYLGAAYAGTIAVRLGQVFGRSTSFSLFWLTLGAPVGMYIIARSKQPLHPELLEHELTLLDIKAIRRAHAQSKSSD
jgi:hypothetical protein